jgi:hypothetical protein
LEVKVYSLYALPNGGMLVEVMGYHTPPEAGRDVLVKLILGVKVIVLAELLYQVVRIFSPPAKIRVAPVTP